jgi:hypothetical protein
MREGELVAVLRKRLSKVNAEWQALTRQEHRSPAKLERMNELRTRRLALMTELFEIDRRTAIETAA